MDEIICARCENSFWVRDEGRLTEWVCSVCGFDDYWFPGDEGYEDDYGESVGDTDRLREY